MANARELFLDDYAQKTKSQSSNLKTADRKVRFGKRFSDSLRVGGGGEQNATSRAKKGGCRRAKKGWVAQVEFPK